MSGMRECEIDIFNRIKCELTEIFDVGSDVDIDYYKLHPIAMYHLFEPKKLACEELHRLLPTAQNVKIHNYACGNKKSIVRAYPDTGAVLLRTMGVHCNINVYEVSKMIRLDSYIEKNNIQRFDFLKIDAEGYEYKILQGLGKYLHNFKFVQLEYSDMCQEPTLGDEKYLLKDLFNIFDGYYALHLEYNTIYTEYLPSLETFSCCNYLFFKPEYERLVHD